MLPIQFSASRRTSRQTRGVVTILPRAGRSGLPPQAASRACKGWRPTVSLRGTLPGLRCALRVVPRGRSVDGHRRGALLRRIIGGVLVAAQRLARELDQVVAHEGGAQYAVDLSLAQRMLCGLPE